jgi:hypothetical protein
MRKRHGWGQKEDWEGIERRDIIGGSCQCPRCGYKMFKQAAVPCSSIPCPQCGAPMQELNWR